MDDKKSGRLQSLKLPRDLSLGLGRPKKQYTPNLNVVRNKDKPKEILKKNDQKRREKSSFKNKNEKQNHDSRYVQSTSVFSQGTGEINRLTSHIERRVSLRDSNNSSVSKMILPTINRNSWNASTKTESPTLDEVEDYEYTDEEKMSFAPLTLSVDSLKKVKNEVIVKKEESVLGSFLPEPFNSEFCSEENPALSLIKLPDSFAGKGLSDDPSVKKLFDYPLSGMLEGQIGKLIIRKSGKIEAEIGRIKYELSIDNTFESKEELATITHGQNGENYIAILGSVLNNFIMSPDYDSLLKKK